MKKAIILSLLLSVMLINKATAQIEIAKLLGKNSSDYLPGVGAFLKFNLPVTAAGDISIEGGALAFLDKEYPEEYAIVMVPLKIGYRHTLNGTGTGFYAEPQIGYNLFGVDYYYDYNTYDNVEKKITGFIWSAGTGYLFKPSRRLQFDLGLRYESVIYKGGSKSFIALRLSNNFSFRKREE